MELNSIINGFDNKWSVSNSTIYYFKYQRIPVARLENSIIYVFFDMKIFKQINKVIEKLISSNFEFYLIDALFSDKQKYDDEFYHYFNLLSYVYGYSNPQFFDFFKKINFDIFENMTKYITKHNCFYLLDDAYYHIKNDLLKKYNSWIGYVYKISLDKIEREDIREEIIGIDRAIKLNLIV